MRFASSGFSAGYGAPYSLWSDKLESDHEKHFYIGANRYRIGNFRTVRPR
jgi:hypothetical protein